MIRIEETHDCDVLTRLNEEVQTLHLKLYPDFFKPYNQVEMKKALLDFLLDPNCKAYLAFKNNLPVGYALFFVKESKENAFQYSFKSLYVDQISVLKEHQRSGIGQLLLEQGEKIAKALGIKKLEIDHWAANDIAASHFRKNGYRLYKERLFKFIE